MSLINALPAPLNSSIEEDRIKRLQVRSSSALSVSAISSNIPPYGHRKGWIPRILTDFADGGAFPEIAIAQYPLGMGQGESKRGNALPMVLDSSGKIKYELLLKEGQGSASDSRVIYSKLSDLQPKAIDDEDPTFQRPTEDEVEALADKTREALDKLVASRISSAITTPLAEKPGAAQYIRYTPAQQGLSYASGAKQRVIRMVDAQHDPLSPPRFRINKKIPKGPPSPPPPVMHSPPRKLTSKEQSDWKIPPCISNWKNPKGMTIPLDKRLAADGRGMQSVHLNEKFAQLSESLYIADRKAREAVEMRAQIEKKVAQRNKEKQEEQLRLIAQRAREERIGIKHVEGADEAAAARDDIRKELAADRARDRNTARAAGTSGKLGRERDITEEIALNPARKPGGNADSLFDTRLFNQSKGLDTGFGAGDDESYNVYDAAWRSEKNLGSAIYRPSKNLDKDIYGEDLDKLASSKKFVPDKEFSGADRGRTLTGPVTFERGGTSRAAIDAGKGKGVSRAMEEEEADPFGLKDFLTQAKQAGTGASSSSSSRPAGGGSSSSSGAGQKRPAPPSAAFESSREKKRDRRD